MKDKHRIGNVDWLTTIIPFCLIVGLTVLLFAAPEQSNIVISKIRYFFGDTLGSYYLVIGLGIFLISLYFAFSKYGNIVLGNADEQPEYSFFAWGSMMFMRAGRGYPVLFIFRMGHVRR